MTRPENPDVTPPATAQARRADRAWFAFVAVVLIGIVGGLWASPEYRDEAEQTGLVGTVESVSVWIALVGGLGALGLFVAWTVRRAWWRAGVAVILAVGSVWVLLLGAGDGRDERDPGRVQIDHTFSSGGVTSSPGRLLGFGALRLKAGRGVSDTVMGWRFRTVRPAVQVQYLLRPMSAVARSRCRGLHIGFETDAGDARKAGDIYPCDGFRAAAGARLTPSGGYELVAVFRAPPRGGVLVRFADPIVVLRAPDGTRREVSTTYAQELCVVGGVRCVRFLRQNGLDAARAREKIRTNCRTATSGPLFVPPRFIPPRNSATELGRDDRGRACTAVP